MASQNTKKGCGCLFVGWALVIVGAAVWFMGAEVLAPYGNSGYVAVGFALGVGLCCIIIGNVYVKIRNWIKKKLGRNTDSSSSRNSRPSNTGTTPTTHSGTTRRIPGGLPGFPGIGNGQSSRRQSSQQGGTLSNPWGERQSFTSGPFSVDDNEVQDDHHADD